MIKLINPPYIQLAMDIPDVENVKLVLSKISTYPHNLLLEIGTPLLKNEGLKTMVPVFRKFSPQSYLIADLKTLDVGELEVEMVAQTSANACVVSGLAPLPTVKAFIRSCRYYQLDSWIDTLGTNIRDFQTKLKQIDPLSPDVIILHRGIDEEIAGRDVSLSFISKIKAISNCLVASAGGITKENIHIHYRAGADIFIVGRAIYQSQNPSSEIKKLFESLKPI